MRKILLPAILAAAVLLPGAARALSPIQPVESPRLGWSALPGPSIWRSVTGAALLGNDIYTIGGWSPRILSRFQPEEFKWTSVAEVPHGIFTNDTNVQLLAVGGNLYAVNDKHFAEFDMSVGTWHQLADPPAVRSYPGFVAHSFGGKVLIIGGMREITDARGDMFPASIKDVSVYDPIAGSWTSGPELPTELGDVHVAEWAGRLVAAGTSTLWPGYRLYSLSDDGTSWQDFGLARSFANKIKVMFGVGTNLYFIDEAGHVTFEDWNGNGDTIMVDELAPCQLFSKYGYFSTVIRGDDLYVLGGPEAHMPMACGSGAGSVSLRYGWGGLVFTFGLDRDGDQILDSVEQWLGTDSTKADTDGDGHGDLIELLNNYDPTTAAAKVDSYSLERLRGSFALEGSNLWYIDPVSNRRYRVNGASSGIQLLRAFGTGATDVTLDRIAIKGTQQTSDRATARPLAGRILIQVQQKGQAWYVNPQTLVRYQLGTGDDLNAQLRSLATARTAAELRSIPVGSDAFLKFSGAVQAFLKSYPAASLYQLLPHSSPYRKLIEAGGKLGT